MKELKRFTVEEFQKDFDDLISRVENGESFLIDGEYGVVAIIPYKDYAALL